MRDVIDLIGRVFLSFIFFYDAYDTIFYFKDTRDKMTEYGLTWNQDLLLYGSIFLRYHAPDWLPREPGRSPPAALLGTPDAYCPCFLE